METAAQTSVCCPACQAVQAFVPTTSFVEGGEALAALFRGQVNVVTCAGCGKRFLFETPLTYRHDTQYFVYYLPRSMVPDLDEAIGRMNSVFDAQFAGVVAERLPVLRLTVQRNQFIEKIALHRDEFDDRLIEYVKYQLFQHSPGLDPVRVELLYDFGNEDEGAIQFLALDRESGKLAYRLGFQMDDYQELERYFLQSDDMVEELNGLFHGAYVQVEELL